MVSAKITAVVSGAVMTLTVPEKPMIARSVRSPAM